MAIPFQEIPNNLKVPLFYAELRGAQTPYNAGLKLLLMGHKNLVYGTPVATVDTPYILSGDRAAELFGRGSQLEAMYRKARANAPFAEIWGIAASEGGSPAYATGSITVTGTVGSKSGLLSVWVAGYPCTCKVAPGDTAAQLATKIKNAINANTSCPVLATTPSDTTVVTVTAKWKGLSGNDITLYKNVYGVDNALSRLITVVQLSGGLGAATLTSSLAAVSAMDFDVIACGYSGATAQLDSLDTYYNHTSGQWSPYKQKFGHALLTKSGSFSALTTLGAARNGPHVSLIGIYAADNAPWEYTAAWAAQVVKHFAAPPELSRPEQTIELFDVSPPRNPANWFTIEERQALLVAGVSTWSVNASGRMAIERLVTTYQSNSWGDPDESWKDAITLFQAMFFVRYMRAQITGTFPRAALTKQDSGIPGFASPGQIKDCMIHGYQYLQDQGLVENIADFAEALIVEIPDSDPNRVNIMARPDMVNQLRIVATLIETNLELDLAAAA